MFGLIFGVAFIFRSTKFRVSLILFSIFSLLNRFK